MTRFLFVALFGLGFAARAVAAPPASPPPVAPAPVEIVVEAGYHPDRVVVREGEPVVLSFLRKEYTGCTREVVFPTLGLRRELPTGERVLIDLGTPSAGEVVFHCGMNMFHGVVVVESGE